MKEELIALEQKLYNNLFLPGYKADITKEDILAPLPLKRDENGWMWMRPSPWEWMSMNPGVIRLPELRAAWRAHAHGCLPFPCISESGGRFYRPADR